VKNEDLTLMSSLVGIYDIELPVGQEDEIGRLGQTLLELRDRKSWFREMVQRCGSARKT